MRKKKAPRQSAAGVTAEELELRQKRSRFPGTPSMALRDGRGVLTLTDVLVTWVFTDIEGSTQLWEWDAEVMDQAVEEHNQVRAWVRRCW